MLGHEGPGNKFLLAGGDVATATPTRPESFESLWRSVPTPQTLAVLRRELATSTLLSLFLSSAPI